MLLAPPILFFLALVPLCRGRLSALVELQFRRPWLLWAALALQIFLFMPGGPAWPAVHLISYALAGAFAWSNRRIPYLWLLSLGGALNLVAIAANGGTMPASPAAETAAGFTGTDPANSAVLAHPHLAFLGDVFAIPASWPLHNVFSVGDVILVVAAGLLIHRVTGSRLLPRSGTARPASPAPGAYAGRVPRLFRLAIDEDTLTDELFAFVVDPRSTRYQRRVVKELRAIAPGMIPVMEMMILDGVQDRRHVHDYVHAILGDDVDADVYYAT